MTKRVTADQVADKIATSEYQLENQINKTIEREYKRIESKLGDLQNLQATTKS
jgi:hypothetical protein